MKLMCIECPEAWSIIAALAGGSYPQVGDEVIAIDTKRCSCGKHDVYLLKEHWLACGFATECFATLSDGNIEEVEQEQKELITS